MKDGEMKHLLHSMIATTLLISIGSTNAIAADDPQQPLKMRIGTWTTKTTYKKAEWTPEPRTVSGVETIKWALDKAYIQGNGEVKSEGVRSHWLMKWDKDAKFYRIWYFDNKNVFPRGDTIGRWDAKSNTMKWTSEVGNSNRGRSTWRFIDKDHFQWTMTIHDRNGKLLMDMVGDLTRKK